MKKNTFKMLFSIIMLVGILFIATQHIKNINLKTDVNYNQTEVKLPIIMYHSILKDEAQYGDYILSPQTLENDLDYLKQNGYETVTIYDLVRYVDGICDLPEKPIMITFDDGHFNNFLYAYPMLKERNMKAVISVIGNLTEEFTENEKENAYWSYLNADRLKEMSDIFEIQNHSYNMHNLKPRNGSTRMRGETKEQYQKTLIEDTEKLQKLINNYGLPAPVCYTYPYGIYSSESEEILKNLGFVATLTCEERINKITRNPNCLFKLGRFNRPSFISSEEFFKKIL